MPKGIDFPPQPKKDEQDASPTAMELALKKAEEKKEDKERALGEAIGNEVFEILKDAPASRPASESAPVPVLVPEAPTAPSSEKLLDVDVSTARTSQYKPRRAMQADMNRLQAKEKRKGGYEPKPVGGNDEHQAAENVSKADEIAMNDMWGGEPPVENYWVVYGDNRHARLSSELESAAEPESQETLSETRGRFASLMARAKEMFNMSPRAERVSGGLRERSAELDAKAAEIGGMEKLFRSLGESYDHLDLLDKFGIGVLLGVGTAASAGISLPLTLTCSTLIGLQRVAGMASAFLKTEKYLQETKEEEAGFFVPQKEWFREKVAGQSEQKKKEIAMLMAGVWTVSMGYAIKEGIGALSDSAAGERLRDWLKNSWLFDDMKAAALPAQAGPETAPATEAAIVHAPEAPATIHAEESRGSGLYYGNPAEAKDLAPNPPPPPTEVVVSVPVEQAPAPVETAIPTPAVESSESPAQAVGAPTPVEEVVTPEPIQAVDLTHEQAVASQPVGEAAPAATAENPTIVANQFGIEVPADAPHLYADAKGDVLAFGGSPLERAKMIEAYLTENPDKVVFNADDNGEHRLLWRLVDGKAEPDAAPMRTSGLFGLFSSWVGAPSPDELAKLIK